MPPQSRLADRRWLEQVYLPSLKGTVLFVGVREYCAGYAKLVQNPETFTTVDPDPEQAKYGGTIHQVCRAEQLVGLGLRYDHVCLFGLFGMRDSLICGKEIGTFVRLMSSHTAKTLLYGTSTDTMTLADADHWFRASGMGNRLVWPTTLASFLIRPSLEHSPMLIRWKGKR
jgi:hypothetical protein